jgi:hypothetical protein
MPPVGGIEGEHAAGPIPIGEVVVLRMGAERIGDVAAAGDPYRLARTYEYELAIQLPARRDRAPAALQLRLELAAVLHLCHRSSLLTALRY